MIYVMVKKFRNCVSRVVGAELAYPFIMGLLILGLITSQSRSHLFFDSNPDRIIL